METSVLNRYLRFAFELMNDVQLKSIETELNERMDYLKTYLIEQSEDSESANIVRQEYNMLKGIKGMFVVDLQNFN